MITIPVSRLVGFRKPEGQRLGQAVHNLLQLCKVTNPEDKEWCDRLWNADGEVAQRMIDERLDREN
ncbi:hypothetical protein AVT69_gp034 [Pseudomonas phage PhiPA3]|uniref:Uncharacterized protein 033 n=1 Tax=Pseudomonas phage PhiPA3 TaxID=998086 RepID=F8SJR5_BPPA3|nr:hypothetical protein AVT69_gp034 [Pseudomonas phage PhiPA3]AEH03460.1 hypothetical protein [Pseudomonas phage PhiPA3]